MRAITDGPVVARISVLALAMLCLIQAVRISLLLVSGPILPLSPVATRASPPTTGPNTPSIADWHLFGTPGKTQPAPPATQLALRSEEHTSEHQPLMRT